MSQPRELRPLQFRLITVMMAVTLLAILCGAIRWLFILVPTEVAISELVAMSLMVAFVRSYSVGWRLWRRRQDRRERERQLEATRILMESTEVQEALRAARTERLAKCEFESNR